MLQIYELIITYHFIKLVINLGDEIDANVIIDETLLTLSVSATAKTRLQKHIIWLCLRSMAYTSYNLR
jgi:hypothetical protein